jgi:hypothetical protein
MAKFVKEENLVIIHEQGSNIEKIKTESPSPLAQNYEKRKKRHRQPKEVSPSPPLKPETVAKAAELGIEIVSRDKAEGQMLGVIDPKLIQEAIQALAAIPEELRPEVIRQVLARKAAQSVISSTCTPVFRSTKKEVVQPIAPAKNVAQSAPSKNVLVQGGINPAIELYYRSKLAHINAHRQINEHGNLNAASRKFLRELCKIHYNERPDRAVGFGGTGLQKKWDDQFYFEFDPHPDESQGNSGIDID